MSTPLKSLLRQQAEPFVIPQDAILGVYRIENGEELQRTVKVKHLHDVAGVIEKLASDEAWLIYTKEADGRSTIVAMSQRMAEALQ